MNIRLAIRNWLFTSDELDAIAFHTDLVAPERAFFKFSGAQWSPLEVMPTLDGSLALEKIYWGTRKRLGWAERVSIEVSSKSASIGHFGIAKDYLRMGLATRLVSSLGRQLRIYHGVTTLRFGNSGEDYARFFDALGARRIDLPTGQYFEWPAP